MDDTTNTASTGNASVTEANTSEDDSEVVQLAADVAEAAQFMTIVTGEDGKAQIQFNRDGFEEAYVAFLKSEPQEQAGQETVESTETESSEAPKSIE